MYNIEHPDFYIDTAKYDDDVVMYSSTMAHCQDHLEFILKQLYGNEPLDIDQFERSLDEVAFGLRMKLPANDLQIQRV